MPLVPSPQLWQPQCVQILPNVPWGAQLPLVESRLLYKNPEESISKFVWLGTMSPRGLSYTLLSLRTCSIFLQAESVTSSSMAHSILCNLLSWHFMRNLSGLCTDMSHRVPASPQDGCSHHHLHHHPHCHSHPHIPSTELFLCVCPWASCCNGILSSIDSLKCIVKLIS